MLSLVNYAYGQIAVVSRYNTGVGSWQNTSGLGYLHGNICDSSPPFLRLCLGVCNYCPGPTSLSFLSNQVIKSYRVKLI